MNVDELLKRLEKNYPDAGLELRFETPFQLLIAVILSAQAKDETINHITPQLFEKYPNPESLARADLPELEKLIKKSGFYRRKAKLIKECASALVERYNGKIPEDIDELASLPGVGRKTAAMVLGNALKQNQGIAVDTHVKRVVNRLGWISSDKPDHIEMEMMKQVPREKWTFISNALILHGRYICRAKDPECGKCILGDICMKLMQ